jgi:hypothetical protein
MSTHCGRYPSCGCSSYIGTKCQLPEGHPPLFEKEPDRNENGYPLTEVGNIDWALTSKEKQEIADKFENLNKEGKSKKPHRKYPTNYTKPKKRRK